MIQVPWGTEAELRNKESLRQQGKKHWDILKWNITNTENKQTKEMGQQDTQGSKWKEAESTAFNCIESLLYIKHFHF